MSDFKIITPYGAVNLFTNPSFEDGATNWAGTAAGTSVVSTDSVFGAYSTRFPMPGAAGTYYQTLAVTNVQYTLSCYVKLDAGGQPPLNLGIWFDSGVVAYDEAQDIGDDWYRLIYTGTATAGNRQFGINPGGATTTFVVDGFQLELGATASTYCDGDQDGCAWTAGAHESTSERSAFSRAGGIVEDLQDDLHFDIASFSGGQLAPQNVSVDSFSILPGGALNNIKIRERIMTMTGVIRGTSLENMHANKQELVSAILPDSYPQTAEGYQPVRLRYTGAAVEKEIQAHYQSRLEGDLDSREPCAWERVAIRWVCPSPFWYEIFDSAQALDASDAPTIRYITGRLRNTGQWDDLGLAANPTTGGTVRAILYASDGTVYIGGTFTGWDGAVGRDYVASYNPATDTWATVGGASDFNGTVYALVEGPDGTIYAGGTFANCAGDANADGLAQWDGANWSAVGAGSVIGVRDLIFGFNGVLYIGGNFANFGGVANADNLAQWNGAAYAAVGAVAGPNNPVYALGRRQNGNIVLGGQFTTVGGVNADRIAEWDGSAFSEVGNGIGNNNVYSIDISDDDIIYVGGDFTTDGDANALLYIASINGGGVMFSDLGGGANGSVLSVNVAPDGVVYACGSFTEIGTITLVSDCAAKWNGASWAALDLNYPATTANVIETFNADPVIASNYDVYIGLSATGAATIAGIATATNDGTAIAFPQIIIEHTGGGDVWIIQIRNETTGKEILINNYYLLTDETLTIDLSSTSKRTTSNVFGERQAILAGSDVGEWSLQPGSNEVTLYCVIAPPASVNAFLLWRNQYNGVD